MTRLQHWIKRIKVWFGIVAIYLSIAGLSSFAMFIMEEAFQTTMFGTWQAINCQDWKLVKKGSGIMSDINQGLKVVNYSTGWINPLAFLSYYNYAKSADYYVEALNANIFANEPALFDGKVMSFRFTPEEFENAANGKVMLRNRNVEVIADAEPPLGMPIRVTGHVHARDGKIVVTETKISQ